MKKIKILLLLLGMAVIATNTNAETLRRKRGKKAVASLDGKTLRVFNIIGVSNQFWPYANYGPLTYMKMSFSGKYIEFVPDSTQTIRLGNLYQLGDTQKVKLKFKYGKRLTIYVESNAKDIVMVKPIIIMPGNIPFGGFSFPTSILAGEYKVKRGLTTSGERGYVLTSVGKSPFGGSRLVIELAEIQEF